MVIELFTPTGATLVCQAIAGVQMQRHLVGRNLLEGLVRELLEYQLHRALSRSQPHELESNLKKFSGRVEQDLRRDLEHRGVSLSGLELRSIRIYPDPPASSGNYRWVEFLSPEIGTRDGFQVVMDTVALVKVAHPRFRADATYLYRCGLHALKDALITSAGGLDLEDLLGRRERWTAEAMERAQETLDGAKLHLEFLAITDLKVRPRNEAFRRFGAPGDSKDLLSNLFYMPYSESIKQDESADRPT